MRTHRNIGHGASLARLALVLALVGVPALASSGPPAGSPARAPSAEHAVSVVVELAIPFEAEGSLPARVRQAQRQGIQAAQQTVLSTLAPGDGGVRHLYRSVPALALRVSPAGLSALASSPWVASVREDSVYTPQLDTTVPLVEADQLAAVGVDGSGQVVVVIDTGVNTSHVNLAGKVVAEACFSGDQDLPGNNGDCPNGQKVQLGSDSGIHCTFHPVCYHGTHVAGIAAAAPAVGYPNNWPGVAPGADLFSIRVATLETNPAACSPEAAPCLQIYESDVIAALDEVYDNFRLSHPIAVVNLSLGGERFTSEAACDADNGPTRAAVDNLRSVGIATVGAAGNDGEANAISEPGCISTVASVGATSDVDNILGISNRGSFLSLWAPGLNVRAPDHLTNDYRASTGTSMAPDRDGLRRRGVDPGRRKRRSEWSRPPVRGQAVEEQGEDRLRRRGRAGAPGPPAARPASAAAQERGSPRLRDASPAPPNAAPGAG